MAAKTSVRINARLVDEAARALGVQSRTADALREAVALCRVKKLMKKYAGKLEFAGYDEQVQNGAR